MIKKYICILFVLIFSFLTVSCSEEVVFEQEKFNHINAYVNEIVPVIEETDFDFNLWNSDLSCPERRGWLKLDADRIKDINQRYLTNDFPAYEEIENWVVPVSDGENRWTIKGTKLAPALRQLQASSKELVLLIDEIIQSEDGRLLTQKRELMIPVLNQALEAAEELTALFYGE
jgi:hypothetical protein